MRKGKIIVYYGGGKGKTCVAVGRGLRAIGDGLRVVMIQFMDYYNSREMSLLKKLEPDFRIFRFEKDRSGEEVCSAEVDSTVRKEISGEIRNAYNFAKKIVDTGECEMLMLDGVLECVEKEYIGEAGLAAGVYGYPDDRGGAAGGTCRDGRMRLPDCRGEVKDGYCVP